MSGAMSANLWHVTQSVKWLSLGRLSGIEIIGVNAALRTQLPCPGLEYENASHIRSRPLSLLSQRHFRILRILLLLRLWRRIE